MKTVKVVAAVIKRENKIFATARGYGKYKGWWEFPGGKIEPGETMSQALKREIEEELDTIVDIGEHIGCVEYDYPEFHLSMECFWCSVKSGDLILKEAMDAKWLDKDNIDTVKWLPADMIILEKIKAAM